MKMRKIQIGLYEFKGFTFRDCSDDYQRAWAIEKNDDHLAAKRTIKECKEWVEKHLTQTGT